MLLLLLRATPLFDLVEFLLEFDNDIVRAEILDVEGREDRREGHGLGVDGAALNRGQLRWHASPRPSWVLAGEESLHVDAEVVVREDAQLRLSLFGCVDDTLLQTASVIVDGAGKK